MMKKLIIALLCLGLLAGLTACGCSATVEPENSAESTQESSLPVEGDESSPAPESSDTPESSADTESKPTGDNTTVGEQPTKGTTKVTDGHTDKSTTAPTTAKKPTTTTTSSEDNNVEFDWGDLDGDKTTKKPTTTTTTKKPTTVTTSKKGEKVYPKEGDDIDGRLQLGTVTVKGNKITMVVKNTTKGWETNQDSLLTYTCYNNKGKKLAEVEVPIGRIHKQEQTTVEFEIPKDTMQVLLTDTKIEYWTDGFH